METRDVSSQTAAAIPVSLFTAAADAQERWVEAQAAQLTCLDQDDRELIASTLKSAGTRAAADWTASFAARVSGFALWSGLVFASVIGATLWAVRIPSRGVPAATAAAAYLVIAVVAVPGYRVQARKVLDYVSRISAKARRDFLTPYLAFLSGAAILYGIANASAFNAIAHRHVSAVFYIGEFAAFAAVTAIGFVLAYLVMAYAYASALQEPGTSQALGWAGMLAATAITGWTSAARRSPAPVGNRRLDSGLLCLLRCAVIIDGLGRHPSLADSRTVRSAILTLELAAADIEHYAVDRVPMSDTATRRLAHQDGIALASVIRDAKAKVARAVYSRDYSAVAATLADFLLTWARPETSGVAAIASGDPSNARVPMWQRIVGRIWNAVLLAAAAIVLPLLPIYNSDHAAAAGLRYALLTAAVLALATGGGPSSDTIQRNLENTLPSGASHAPLR